MLDERGPVPAWQSKRVPLSADVGVRTAACKTVWGLLYANQPPASMLVWTRDGHVFESAEYLPLAATWLAGAAGISDLESVEGLVVDASTEQHAVSLLLIAVYFFWDCWIFDSTNDRFVLFSHDEFVITGGLTDGRQDDTWLAHFESVMGAY
jgi:hypothetical protein